MTHFSTLLSQQNNVSLECSILCFIKLPCRSPEGQAVIFISPNGTPRFTDSFKSHSIVPICIFRQLLLMQYKIFVSNISLFLSQSLVKRPWAEYVWGIVVLVFCGLASSQPWMIRVEEMPSVCNIRQIAFDIYRERCKKERKYGL